MTYREHLKLAEDRDRSVELADRSGGYSEYRLRCECSDLPVIMDEETFLARKKLLVDGLPTPYRPPAAFDEFLSLAYGTERDNG